MTKNINTNKHSYVKPSMQVYPLNHQPQLLAGSPKSMPLGDPDEPTTEQW